MPCFKRTWVSKISLTLKSFSLPDRETNSKVLSLRMRENSSNLIRDWPMFSKRRIKEPQPSTWCSKSKLLRKKRLQ